MTQELEHYLVSLGQRWLNMQQQGIDSEGWEKFSVMIQRIEAGGKITPGEHQYLWDRTHSRGRYSNYNKARGLHRRCGVMLPWTPDLIAITDWSIPHPFRLQIEKLGYRTNSKPRLHLNRDIFPEL